MPYKSNNTNHKDRSNLGRPTGEGKPKGTGDLHVPQDMERDQRLAAEYTENEDLNETPTSITRHPNRNTDKPQLDQPPYNGGH